MFARSRGLANGFIASKVLFASLNTCLFDQRRHGSRTLEELATATDFVRHRLETLLTGAARVGLVDRTTEGFVNVLASQDYLVSTSSRYFGECLRFRIDRQVYPLLSNLDAGLRDTADASHYDLMTDDTEADHFTRAQHVDSLGPAAVVQSS